LRVVKVIRLRNMLAIERLLNDGVDVKVL
jgi:hypothetical protein